MKVKLTVLACLAPIFAMSYHAENIPGGEACNLYYTDYVITALDSADKYLIDGDIENAKSHYSKAEEHLRYLPIKDLSCEARITFSKLVMKIIVDKDKDAIKDFVKYLFDHVEYKDGKIIVDLELLKF